MTCKHEEPQDTLLLMANIRSTGECVSVRVGLDSFEQTLKVMERFLRGCGYYIEGELQVVPYKKSQL